MKTQKMTLRILVFSGLLYATNCLAQETITIEGWTVTCQNRCVVTANSDGSYGVTDSKGGWIDATPPIE
jgi:hypothetical protein